MQQRVAAAPRDEHIDASVSVEIAERGITRVAAAGETEARRRFGERPVEIVSVDGAPTLSDEEKIEIAVVIEVDEQRFARALDVGDSRLRRHVLETSVAAIAEQVTASLAADDEEIEPAVVVVVRERRVRCALRKRDARALGSVADESAPNAIEMCDRLAPAGDKSRRTCRPCRRRRHRQRQAQRGPAHCGAAPRQLPMRKPASLVTSVNLTISIAGRCRDRAQRDEILRRKRQDRTSRDRTFGRLHFLERRLIRRRDLHQVR